MLQRFLLPSLAAFVLLGATACKKSPAAAAAAKIAAEKADKKQKAIKNYQELVKKYPQSEYAEKAKTRLQALGPESTPGKK
jgi:TolA-binding protein